MFQHYVLGFLFSADRSQVALIRKNRPAWQAGKLNGIGGKVEAQEAPLTAMVREFEEETGVTTLPDQWSLFGVLCGDDFKVWCFSGADDAVHAVASRTDETVVLLPASLNRIAAEGQSNLATLVGHALDPDAAFLTLDYHARGDATRASHLAHRVPV